ncbi:C-type lectin domain family 4 member M, partial [Biomphalaria pfeifferi]
MHQLKVKSVMHTLHFSHLCVFVFFCCSYRGLAGEITSAILHQVEKNQPIKLYSTSTIQARSLVDCARKCHDQNCACYSYSMQSCFIGKCNLTITYLEPGPGLYVSCFSSDGFNFVTIGSVSACVWVSAFATDYITARDDCRDKDAHLYTVKTMDKLKWLQTNYPKFFLWVGLNDIDVEGTYRWEDDNTVCNSSCLSQYFIP